MPNQRAGDIASPLPQASGPYGWLAEHASHRPTDRALLIWEDGAVARERTWAQWRQTADRTIGGLAARAVGAGDRVVLVLPNDESFAEVLVACSGAGAIPVPASVPAAGRMEAFTERLAGIADACLPTLIVTTEQWRETVTRVVPPVPAATAAELADGEATPGRPTADGPALLQFTSGSTNRPRGVAVTAAALRANLRQATQAYAETTNDIAVSWVPLFHDMGLITGLMRPLRQGYPSVLMRPDEFVRRPESWLRAIDRCGGTLSSAPNFAYELCVRKVPAETPLDLSRWRVARNAGEVVRDATLRRFAAHFAATGFNERALAPSYGLAEATLTVTATGPLAEPRRLFVNGPVLARGTVRELDPELTPDDGRWLVSSGIPLEDSRIRIADAPAPDGVGCIEVAGPQVSTGYWTPDSRPSPQSGHWHRTGDLGFLKDGHLFVLGRADDTLIIQGHNVFAVDVAAICGAFPELRPGRLAAFIAEPEETVVLVAETTEVAPATRRELQLLRGRVQRALAGSLGLFVHRVHLVPKGTLPVTTSGKVRVSEARRRFVEGLLHPHTIISDADESKERTAAHG